MSADQDIATFISSKFKALHQRGLFSGGLLLAACNDIPPSLHVFGLADYRSNRALSQHSLYETASITKIFTAAAIQLLEEAKQLRLEDKLSRWLPHFPYKEVTIMNALTHTSGLPDYMDLMDAYTEKARIYNNADVISMLILHAPSPHFQAGERYEYSNTGYVCLASVIEAASGMSYAEFMQTFVFKPARMNKTRVYNRRIRPEAVTDLALGWIKRDDVGYSLPDEDDAFSFVITLDGIQGDGTIHSTLGDLHAFDQALRNGQLLNRESLIRASSPHKLPDGTFTPCGIGWFLSRSASNQLLLSHSGGWPGYWSRLVRAPHEGKVLIVLANVEVCHSTEAALLIGEAEQLWFQ